MDEHAIIFEGQKGFTYQTNFVLTMKPYFHVGLMVLMSVRLLIIILKKTFQLKTIGRKYFVDYWLNAMQEEADR